jgi:hypothetical protein
MKSLKQIQELAEKGDYSRIGAIVSKSPALVRAVIAGEREDHHNIQQVFSDMLEARERLAKREEKRRQRNRLAA